MARSCGGPTAHPTRPRNPGPRRLPRLPSPRLRTRRPGGVGGRGRLHRHHRRSSATRLPAGGRVLVRPGVYKESLTISKKVEIVADGPADSVVVESVEGNCLLMQADLARVRGLTLRGVSGRQGRGRYAVSVPTGKLILEDCRITSDTLACFAALGSTATAELRHCRVVGGARDESPGQRQADVILEDCDVSENALAGIECRRGGRPHGAAAGFHPDRPGRYSRPRNGASRAWKTATFSRIQAGVGCATMAGLSSSLARCLLWQGPGVRLHGGQATLEDCELFESDARATWKCSAAATRR